MVISKQRSVWYSHGFSFETNQTLAFDRRKAPPKHDPHRLAGDRFFLRKVDLLNLESASFRVSSGVFLAGIMLMATFSACAKREQAQPAPVVVADPNPKPADLGSSAESQKASPAPVISGRGSPNTAEPSQSEAPPLDPRVLAAAALARRTLSDPTPQMEHARKKTKAPKGFDRERYLADPAAYLDLLAPSRSTEPAQPAADVPMIETIGPTTAGISVGESCTLRVKTEPGMPVSFTSSGLGSFDSGFPSITVAANEQGLAEARFTATKGTIGDCPIICASPVRGGTIRFLVRVDDRSSKGNP